ncbi:FecR domain-containing protein [Herbaspirillum sp. alder98]|uniref:FecR domain-containing protein n=1 Tax=Herbaspirillum sp. alder98 TaxID=2913096 RepID=UPI001CD82BDF|nr:FecR domain-containing protein [Herbaspirillum sp. alder98]MCA1323672.1 FecR domain-containing protein [Herbaspirillum sp. alder98]
MSRPRMDGAIQEIPFATLEQAAEWFAVLRSGQVAQDERQRWQDWLARDAANRHAWAQVEAISRGISVASAEPAAASSALHAASQLRRRRKLLKTLVLSAVTAGLGWQLARQQQWPSAIAALNATWRTGIGESRNVTLADGSQLWLDTATAVNAQFDDQLRQLTLVRGEMLIQTGTDPRQPPRPFIVQSRDGSMRALGTRFNVRQFDGYTRLSVIEGRVEITPALPGAARQIIAAGEETTFTHQQIATPVALPPARTAWSQGLLIAQDQPLDAFLAELGRYRSGYLGCDPAVAGLRVVGGFPLRDTDQALAMLEAALPVQVRAIMPWWVTLKPRRADQ